MPSEKPSKRYKLDEDVDREPIDIPHVPLVSKLIEIPPPTPEPAVETEPAAFPPVSEQKRHQEESTREEEGNNRIRLLAEQRFKPAILKRATQVRFEPWLDNALDLRVLQLKMEGYRKISREAVIADALIAYLGIRPPE